MQTSSRQRLVEKIGDEFFNQTNKWFVGRAANFFYQREKRFLEDRAINLLEIESNAYILEMGCRNGAGLLALVDKVAKFNDVTVFGVERSPVMADLAQKTCSLEIAQGKVKVFRCFPHTLPFLDNYFDRVFHCDEYYFWSDKIKTVKEIFRTMKPGALMICTLDLERLRKYYHLGILSDDACFDPLDYMTSLDAVGFEAVNVEYLTYDEERRYLAIRSRKPMVNQFDNLTDERLADEEAILAAQTEFVEKRSIVDEIFDDKDKNKEENVKVKNPQDKEPK